MTSKRPATRSETLSTSLPTTHVEHVVEDVTGTPSVGGLSIVEQVGGIRESSWS